MIRWTEVEGRWIKKIKPETLINKMLYELFLILASLLHFFISLPVVKRQKSQLSLKRKW